MVNIHHHQPLGPVSDEPAMEMFRKQWAIYEKFIEHDYLATKDVSRCLHGILARDMARPFRFLDLACGDAKGIVAALKGTQVSHYHGVDLAQPALDMAKANVDTLACQTELEHADFVEAIRDRPEPADVVWIGLSLHHLKTPDKGALMREIRDMIDSNGLFLIYEPTKEEGEIREEFLDRFERITRPLWPAFTDDEWAAVQAHVRGYDLPETGSGWLELGRGAGFEKADEVFRDPTGFLRMFCYRP